MPSEIVYCNGKIRRVSYPVHSNNAAEIVDLIKQHFPNESKYLFNSEKNHIGISDGYRTLYNTGDFSLYSFMKLPEEIIDRYGVDTSSIVPKQWFGLKFNMITKEVMLKLPFDDPHNSIKKPKLPNGIKYYGMLYREDKTIHNEVDCYLCSLNKMNHHINIFEYCRLRNIPLPTEDKDVLNKMYLWGIVYDSSDLSIKMIKGYDYPKQINK